MVDWLWITDDTTWFNGDYELTHTRETYRPTSISWDWKNVYFQWLKWFLAFVSGKEGTSQNDGWFGKNEQAHKWIYDRYPPTLCGSIRPIRQGWQPVDAEGLELQDAVPWDGERLAWLLTLLLCHSPTSRRSGCPHAAGNKSTKFNTCDRSARKSTTGQCRKMTATRLLTRTAPRLSQRKQFKTRTMWKATDAALEIYKHVTVYEHVYQFHNYAISHIIYFNCKLKLHIIKEQTIPYQPISYAKCLRVGYSQISPYEEIRCVLARWTRWVLPSGAGPFSLGGRRAGEWSCIAASLEICRIFRNWWVTIVIAQWYILPIQKWLGTIFLASFSKITICGHPGDEFDRWTKLGEIQGGETGQQVWWYSNYYVICSICLVVWNINSIFPYMGNNHPKCINIYII